MTHLKTYKVALGKRYIQKGITCILIRCYGNQRMARKIATTMGYTVSGVKSTTPKEVDELLARGVKFFRG